MSLIISIAAVIVAAALIAGAFIAATTRHRAPELSLRPLWRPVSNTLWTTPHIERALDGLTVLSSHIHMLNRKWWVHLEDNEKLGHKKGERKERNVGEILMLITSEIAEAMEGHRKNLRDDKLPHRSMFEVELADAYIRIADLCGALQLDLAGAVRDKLEYNLNREDHTDAHRLSTHGKKY